MASRKEQLNAYTFARKRTVAAFLQPNPSGSEEGAPRPLRALAPGIVVGALILAGFGAWGLVKPTAPKGWDDPGKNVIVADESTTRYVILKDERTGEKLLHPVLNFASARLLLDPQGYQVIKVRESVIDKSGIKHGATIGIPYAPDRLPSPVEAGLAKKWAVCDRPGSGADKVADQAVFVLGGADARAVDSSKRLAGNEVLYVESPDSSRYLVDKDGTSFPLGGRNGRTLGRQKTDLLLRTLFGQSAEPQRVTLGWLGSLNPGSPIVFPTVAHLGDPAHVDGLSAAESRIGNVLEATSAAGKEYYVVQKDGVAPTTAFTALLLEQMTSQTEPIRTSVPTEILPVFTGAGRDWPVQQPTQVNKTGTYDAQGRTVACSVLRGTAGARPELSVWAGTAYPASIVDGATSAYVTPGSGLLYLEITGKDLRNGTLYLTTDTGLRYAVPRNNDSDAADGTKARKVDEAVNQAQARLGYDSVTPDAVPLNWSEFLPKGPALDTESARRPQGS
ncbi:type VII secretion protein EccB [Streptomyces sp. So13.3]|uniref:type VII secretion protein EccB n=1 Tax=unclassified Streptomyces TaxID=2593676 RepID=UPI0011067B4F|nr:MULTISPECIES: type VII secretion protein EccB [unclassified Streptomyces]MCZ4100239.1 type VII secretion protein EccB [Streptomyces sp. H39-C1]QNA75680.1 type VII secretion protein EccB [Streptomyces sp. So13.3]